MVMKVLKDEKAKYAEVSSETVVWAIIELLDFGFDYDQALDVINNL